MRPSLHGQVGAPAIAVIGVWDPISAVQRQLFARLSAQGRRRGLASVAVAIEPHPAAYLPGEPAFPVYSDLPSRVHSILASGVDGVLCLHFTRRDVHAGVNELLAAVTSLVDLSELWLGATQTLGRLEAGDAAAIDEAAKRHGVKVTRLDHRPRPTQEVQQLLRAGRIREASRLVGQPPFRRRPRLGTLKFGWPSGRYEAIPVPDPTSSRDDAPLMLELSRAPRGSARLIWPDPAIEYLAFVAGPGDAPRVGANDARPAHSRGALTTAQPASRSSSRRTPRARAAR